MDDLAIRSAGALSAPATQAGNQVQRQEQQQAAPVAEARPEATQQVSDPRRVEAPTEPTQANDGVRGQVVDRYA